MKRAALTLFGNRHWQPPGFFQSLGRTVRPSCIRNKALDYWPLRTGLDFGALERRIPEVAFLEALGVSTASYWWKVPTLADTVVVDSLTVMGRRR